MLTPISNLLIVGSTHLENYLKIKAFIERSCNLDERDLSKKGDIKEGYEGSIYISDLESKNLKFYEFIEHDIGALVKKLSPHVKKCVSHYKDLFSEMKKEAEILEEESSELDCKIYGYLGTFEGDNDNEDLVDDTRIIVQRANRAQLTDLLEKHLEMADQVNQRQTKFDEIKEVAKRESDKKENLLSDKSDEINKNQVKIEDLFDTLTKINN